MKQVHASYTFVASTKTITLTGLNIDQDQLLLIVNATRGVQYFNFADSSLRGVVTSGANTTVVLTDASTTGHSNSDALVIYYDDQVASQAVTGTVTANPGTGAFTVSGTVGLDPASLSALENVTVTIGSSVTVSGTVTANVPLINPEYVRVLPVSAILNLGGDPESNPEVIFGGYYKYAGNNTWKKICEADRGGSPEISIIKYGNGWRVVCNLEGAVGYIFAIENFKNFPEGTFDADGELFGEFTIGSSFIVTLEQPTTQPISGTVTAGVVDRNGLPITTQAADDAIFNEDGNAIQAVARLFDENLNQYSSTNPLPISGTVTVGNSITIGSLPVQLSTTTIGGTARLNVTLSSATTLGATVPSYGNLYGGSDGTNFRAISVDSSGRTVVTGSVSVANLPSTQTVAGTVTANISGTVPVSGTFWQATQPVSLASVPTHGVTLASTTVTVSSLPNVAGTVTANINGTVPVSGTFWQSTQPVSLASVPTHGVTLASTTVTVSSLPNVTIGNSSITVNGNFYQATQPVSLASVPTHGVTLASTTVTVSSLPSISGTVTANLSRPTWADYSGTITTAGTAITAISNTSRSYLLAQVTTGQLFLNIGATATTLNSVYFSAGQGFAWETSVPQGIVSIISSVTGTNYVLKEG